MLVLSRKVGERVLIGDQIAVTIVRINGNAVRLGIDAPSNLVVVRQELADAAEKDKQASAREPAAMQIPT